MLDTKMQQATAKSVVRTYLGEDIVTERIDKIKFDFTNTSSTFDYTKDIKKKNTDANKIFIGIRNAQDINLYVHELFHASSTKYSDNKINIGFNKIEYSKLENGETLETNVGFALNEGATHSMTRDATNGRFGKVIGTTHYNFCANIYKNIENLVGSSLLKHAYINAGLNQFIEIVSNACHTQKENVINLVLNMDAYFNTHRFFSVFAMNENAPDAFSLLSNCYSYLGKIVSDYCKYNGKKFDIFENIKNVHLEGQEIITFYNALRNVHKLKNDNYSLKDFEKMAQFLYSNNPKFNFNVLSDNYKCAEFYNYLLLNNFYVDENNEKYEIKSFEVKSKLTECIFNEKQKLFKVDENLPYNTRTVLSTRFVVRADTTVSDYYMLKSLSDQDFCNYLKDSDEQYYASLIKQSKKDDEQSL